MMAYPCDRPVEGGASLYSILKSYFGIPDSVARS